MSWNQLQLPTIAPVFTRWAFEERLRAGRIPARWLTDLEGDPLMRNIAMVFEIALGGPSGRTVRVSTVPIRSFSSRTATRHDAFPGLIEEPSVSADYSLGSATSSARQFDLTVDGQLLDPMSIIRGGGILVGIAEVSLERVDIENDYDERYVLLRGDIVSVVFGAIRSRRAGGRPDDREIVTLQITDPRDSCAANLPPWILDTERLPLLHPSGVGQTYPLIFNSTLQAPTVRATSAATGSNSFIICQGAISVVLAAGNVFINGISVFGGTDAWVLDSGVEDVDRVRYSAIRFTNGGKAWADSDAVHVTAEKLIPASQLGPVGVIRSVVEGYSPIGVQGSNPELFATAQSKYPAGLGAPRVLINATGGAAASVLDWIEGGFLASYPMISMVWANGGYGPILTDSRAAPIADFVVGAFPILDRISLVSETSKADIVNEISVRFGYNPMLDTYAGVVIRSASNSTICQTSRLLVGRRDAAPIDSVYITDLATASYVADWLVVHKALPSYLVEYDAAPRVFLSYQRGDTVRLTDDEFGWVSESATIEKLTYQRGKCSITFRVWLRYLNVGPGALSRPVAA